MGLESRQLAARPLRGFTILEILVVVAVISIAVSTILLNFSINRPDDALKEHTTRVGKTLQMLMQEAILDDRNFAVSLLPQAFLILEYNGETWVQTEDVFLKGLAREHGYDDELVIDNAVVAIEKTTPPKPHILILSSGEMTPFQWDISDAENRLRMRLQSDLLGRIVMQGPTGTFL
jgi:general secretion pathway protein H